MFLKDKYYKKGWDDALYEVLSKIQCEDVDTDYLDWYIRKYLLEQIDPEND